MKKLSIEEQKKLSEIIGEELGMNKEHILAVGKELFLDKSKEKKNVDNYRYKNHHLV